MIRNKLRYKLFKLWKKRQYRQFLKNENWDFDFASIINFLILKFTIMGLQFAKFGVCVDEDRKQQVRELWQARRYLKQYLSAYEWAEKLCQKVFFERYGCAYTTEMSVKNGYLEITCTSPVEKPEEAREFWHSLRIFDQEYQRGQECLKRAFEHIHTHILGWWD